MKRDLFITELLRQWQGGDLTALDQIITELYDFLHRRVHALLAKEKNRGFIDTTDLLHDLYIQLRRLPTVPANNTAHFIRTSAKIIRNLLVNAARRRKAERHGGRHLFVTLTATEGIADEREQTLDLLILDDILTALEGMSPRVVQIAELTIFFRMPQPEIAETLAVSRSTVQRDWIVAKRLITSRYRGEA